MRGPQFCSMKISQDLRDEAAAIEAREKGMAEKSAEFLEKGGSCICESETPHGEEAAKRPSRTMTATSRPSRHAPRAPQGEGMGAREWGLTRP
jgi:hypothetical protein